MADRWWSIASRSPERLILKIHGYIEEDDQGLTDLIRIAKEPEILIRLDSNGGSVNTAQAVQSVLMRQMAQVIVRIEGTAQSAAVLIACAGRVVQAVPEAMLLIHAPFTERGGNSRQHRIWADRLDQIGRDIAQSLASKSGRNADEFLPMVLDGEDHKFSAEEARGLGLVDVILTGAAP